MKTADCLVVAAFGLAILNDSAVVAEADDYIYTTNNSTVTIAGYTSYGGAVSIPETIKWILG